jgi:hypothetical protein
MHPANKRAPRCRALQRSLIRNRHMLRLLSSPRRPAPRAPAPRPMPPPRARQSSSSHGLSSALWRRPLWKSWNACGQEGRRDVSGEQLLCKVPSPSAAQRLQPPTHIARCACRSTCSISARVFITKGPCCTMGSPMGLPAMSRKRRPSLPVLLALALTWSPGPSTSACAAHGGAPGDSLCQSLGCAGRPCCSARGSGSACAGQEQAWRAGLRAAAPRACRRSFRRHDRRSKSRSSPDVRGEEEQGAPS